MGLLRVMGGVGALVAGVLVACTARVENPLANDPLITGKDMTPAASFAQALGSLPVNVAVSPDGRFAVTTDVGYRVYLHVVRMADGKSVAKLDYPNSAPKGTGGAGAAGTGGA